MSTVLHIASASDAGYFPGLEVLVCSTLLHVSPETEVHFHIFDGGINEAGWTKLRQHAARFHAHTSIHPLTFADGPFAGFPGLNGNKLPYARLLLADCLPELDKIVYIDSDIIVGRNLEELRDADMQGRTALVSRDVIFSRLNEDCPWLPEAEARNYTYFNTGVLVLDLVRWRKKGYLQQCLAAIAAKPDQCRYWDQTALNYIIRDDVVFLPTEWNHVAFTSDGVPDHPINLHLISEKPWRTPMPRFDHYVWTQFYNDFFGVHDWTEKSSLGKKILFRLPQCWATRWLFHLSLAVILALTRNPMARKRREQTLRGGMSDPHIQHHLRAEWQKLKNLRVETVAQKSFSR